MASVRYKDGAYLTATGQAYIGQGVLVRAILQADADSVMDVDLYDLAAVGTTNRLTRLSIEPLIAGKPSAQGFEIGREFENGVYAVLTITGTASLTLVFE